MFSTKYANKHISLSYFNYLFKKTALPYYNRETILSSTITKYKGNIYFGLFKKNFWAEIFSFVFNYFLFKLFYHFYNII